MTPSGSSPPLVLIEIGVDDMPNPVVTKDERVTCVSVDWSAATADELPSEYIAEVRAVLGPIRDEHPRFAYVLDRLDREYT